MNKNVISLFTFGLVLILLGAVGTFLDWDQAMTFIGLGLTMESLALIIYAWKKLKK